MQSVIKRPCPATRIHFQPYGQPNVERKTTTGERHPAASSRGSPSTGSHPRRGRRPRRPGNLPPPPIPGKTPGPGMPGPYRAAVGKPYAIHKRPRRGQDPSLRTAPSTSARSPTARRCGNGDKKKPRRSLFPGLPRFLRQYRIIPALRLKHRSGGCGTASALPKCSIIHKVLSALLA